MDNGRDFLETQIKTAKRNLENLANAAREAISQIPQAQNDLKVFESALEAYTRNSALPYKPENPTDIYLPLFSFERDAPDEKDSQNGYEHKESKDNSTDIFSKISVVRELFQTVDQPQTVDSVYEKISANANNTITKDDLYRMLPRMVARKEIMRVGRGKYQKAQNSTNGNEKNKSDSTLESNNPQTNGDFVLLYKVRDVLKDLQGKDFTFDDIFQPLIRDYPNQFDESRKSSLSATLSNMTSSGEIQRVGSTKDLRTLYRVIERKEIE